MAGVKASWLCISQELASPAEALSYPTISFHHWAVFICPAATLPLDRPFLDKALQSNVTCCRVVH